VTLHERCGRLEVADLARATDLQPLDNKPPSPTLPPTLGAPSPRTRIALWRPVVTPKIPQLSAPGAPVGEMAARVATEAALERQLQTDVRALWPQLACVDPVEFPAAARALAAAADRLPHRHALIRGTVFEALQVGSAAADD